MYSICAWKCQWCISMADVTITHTILLFFQQEEDQTAISANASCRMGILVLRLLWVIMEQLAIKHRDMLTLSPADSTWPSSSQLAPDLGSRNTSEHRAFPIRVGYRLQAAYPLPHLRTRSTLIFYMIQIQILFETWDFYCSKLMIQYYHIWMESKIGISSVFLPDSPH